MYTNLKKKALKSPYNHPDWKRISKAYRKVHPLCEMCLAKRIITPSKHTDHINGFTSVAEFFDWNNLQALCIPCHNMKTHTAGGPDWTKREQSKRGMKMWSY